MVAHKQCQIIMLSILAGPLCGCYSYLAAQSPGGWNKMAFAHYEEDFTPPRKVYSVFVRRIGRDRFVEAMAERARQPHHLYAIGWFGDLWHLDVIATYLDADDMQMQQTALAAFGRLTNQDFTSSADALEWWSNHKERFPQWQQRKK